MYVTNIDAMQRRMPHSPAFSRQLGGDQTSVRAAAARGERCLSELGRLPAGN